MRVSFGVAFLLLTVAVSGCRSSDDEHQQKTVTPDGSAPVLQVDPPPGAYDSFVLDVRVSAVEPGIELIFDLNRDPDIATGRWYDGDFSVRLTSGASMVVFARDAEENLWGPYSFSYSLARRDPDGFCRLTQPSPAYFGPHRDISLEVAYSLPTALSTVDLLVGGEEAFSYYSPEIPRGVTTVTMPAGTVEGTHAIRCRVAGPGYDDIEGNEVTVLIDATPPTATWLAEAPWVPPTHFRLQAFDEGGSGVSHAELCDGTLTYCLPMRALYGDRFSLGTAFLPQEAASFQLQVRIHDLAGNVAELAGPWVDAGDVPDGRPPYLHPITLVTDDTLDLAATLSALDGPTSVSEVRRGDFSAVGSVQAVPLTEGWNELYFRADGNAGWETFGVYQAGVELVLPEREPDSKDHQWLIYASRSTVPVLQATAIDQVPVSDTVWFRPWFDVPRLFVVEDRDGTGQWEDDAAVYLLDPEDAPDPGGPWLRRAAPLQAGLQEAVFHPTTATFSTTVTCADCQSGGLLRVLRRAHPYDAPIGRQSWDVSAVELADPSGLALTFSGEAGESCLFFWDEGDTGAVSDQNPRAFGPCETDGFDLQRAAALAVTASAGDLRVEGIPYGGQVTGHLDVSTESERLLRQPLAPIEDLDGNGVRTIPSPRYGAWPSEAYLFSGTDTAGLSLAGTPSDITLTTIHVDVRRFDDAGHGAEPGALMSAAIESTWDGGGDYAVYDWLEAPIPLAYHPDFRPKLRALRDGFLSEWTYVDTSSSATLRLLSEDAAATAWGQVTDTDGQPVADALVTWEGDPWSSRTYTGADGSYELPILGTGRLSVRRGTDGLQAGTELSVTQGEVVPVGFTLPADADALPVGLFSPELSALSGPAPVTFFTDSLYVWADLAPGEWRMDDGAGYSRGFTFPGTIPGLSANSGGTYPINWTAELLEAELSLRCGARRQVVDFATIPRVGVPCWDWYAESNGRTYYLGRPHPAGGMPRAGIRFWNANLRENGTAAPGQTIIFRDLIFNHVVEETSDAEGRIQALLPHGYYRVETPQGHALETDDGEAVLLPVSDAYLSTMTLHLP